MPEKKMHPLAGDLRFDSDKRRSRERARRAYAAQQDIAKKAAKKRAAAAKKGAEGPKQSKPGGYSMGYTPGSSTKKKRQA